MVVCDLQVLIRGGMVKKNCPPGGCVHCGKVPIDGLGFRIVKGESIPYKQCAPCRKAKSEYQKGEAGKKAQKKYEQSAKKKLVLERYREKGNEAMRKWRKTPNGIRYVKNDAAKPERKRQKAQYAKGDIAKSCMKRQYEKKKKNPSAFLWMKMQNKLRRMYKKGVSSKTVSRYTEFASADDLTSHLESQFEDGMTRSNNGITKAGGVPKWHIGHRIARAMYNKDDPVDNKKCWSKANIFPQWGCPNMSLGVALPDDTELIRLRSIWPVAWQDKLPSDSKRVLLERGARGHG